MYKPKRGSASGPKLHEMFGLSDEIIEQRGSYNFGSTGEILEPSLILIDRTACAEREESAKRVLSRQRRPVQRRGCGTHDLARRLIEGLRPLTPQSVS